MYGACHLNEPLDTVLQKSTCNYLKAVNNQDRSKMANKDVTGVVHAQCSHVVIQSTVDLQLGERCACRHSASSI